MSLIEFVNQLLCFRVFTCERKGQRGTRKDVFIVLELQSRLGQRRRFRELAQPRRTKRLVRVIARYHLFRFGTKSEFSRTAQMFIRFTPPAAKRGRLDQPVHRTVFVSSPVRPRNLLLHSLRIATDESHRIKSFANTRTIQLLRKCPLADISRFVETIESDQCLTEVSRPDSRVWIQSLRFSGCGYGLLILSRNGIEISQIAGTTRLTRIIPHIRRLRLNRLLQLAGHDLIVEIRDARALLFA